MSSFTKVPKKKRKNKKTLISSLQLREAALSHSLISPTPVSLYIYFFQFFFFPSFALPCFNPGGGIILPPPLPIFLSFSPLPATFSTFPSCHAVETSSAGGPTGPSRGWGGFPCRRPRRSVQGSRRLYPGASTSSQAWSWGICRPRPWHAPRAAGPRGGYGAHLACKRKWCWRWISTIHRLCLPLERALGQLAEEESRG